jgi:predicted MPP superfamily phosphohydrolase
MKTSTALGVAFGAVVLAVAGLFFEAWLLGVILSWFGMSLTFWQNLAIVFLANLIFKSSVSSK